MPAPQTTGLEGVTAADSGIGFIDGEKGILMYRGYRIAVLAQNSHYEEVSYLLLNGKLPNKEQLDGHIAEIRAAQVLPDRIIEELRMQPRDVHPMTNLRTAVSLLGSHDPEQDDDSPEAQHRKSIRLIARIGTAAAALERFREGKELVAPDPELTYAANFLYMLHGTKPTKEHEKMFDLCLILHAEHGFNASTFSARVTVATLSDLYSGATSAIGTLKGPLHGGANERAMRMLESIGSSDKAEQFVMNALKKKERIMGIGHRVYKTEDPRAMLLCGVSDELSKEDPEARNIFEIGKVVRQVMKREKGLYANVDFCSGIIYRSLGIPITLYTPIFSVSRMSGWVAHMLEQIANNRLIRPRGHYIGEKDLVYLPIDQRS